MAVPRHGYRKGKTVVPHQGASVGHRGGLRRAVWHSGHSCSSGDGTSTVSDTCIQLKLGGAQRDPTPPTREYKIKDPLGDEGNSKRRPGYNNG